jgi:hypothetical protein
MPFDHAPGDGQRQPETAALLIEGSLSAFVCVLYVRFACDDDDGRRAIFAWDQATVDRSVGGGWLLAQHRSEKRRECATEPGAVTAHARACGFAAELQVDITIFGLV